MNRIFTLLIALIIILIIPVSGFSGIGDRFSKIELLKYYIDIPITSTPSTSPSTGHGWLYTKSNGGYSALYFKSDYGAETEITSLNTQMFNTQVRLTNAQIKALNATPKVLVAAPGSGKFIQLVSAVLILDYGSNVLTESADNMVIEYTTSGVDATAAIEATGFIDAAADQMAFIQPATIATATAANIVNKSIQLTNTGDGEYAGNAGADTTMIVRITYKVHETGL